LPLLWAGLAVLLALFGRDFVVFLALDFRAVFGFALLVFALLEAFAFLAGFALFVFVWAILPSFFRQYPTGGPGLPVSRNLPA
jgi:hypothetical protein